MEENSKTILNELIEDLQTFSKGEIDDYSFKTLINKIKKEAKKINDELGDTELIDIVRSIVDFKTIDEFSAVGQILIRVFAPTRYGALVLGWNKKGKYVYDLDQLELKLRGLLFRLENLGELK